MRKGFILALVPQGFLAVRAAQAALGSITVRVVQVALGFLAVLVASCGRPVPESLEAVPY